jgi:N-acetylneuraminic acid mutarotase
MNFAKNGCSSCNIGKIIYVFGGNNKNNGPLSIIEAYNIDEQAWNIHNVNLPVKIYDHQCIVLNSNKVIILGG